MVEVPWTLKKYSKSGAILPAARPVKENQRGFTCFKGRMMAGCEKVKGIEKSLGKQLPVIHIELNTKQFKNRYGKKHRIPLQIFK